MQIDVQSLITKYLLASTLVMQGNRRNLGDSQLCSYRIFVRNQG